MARSRGSITTPLGMTPAQLEAQLEAMLSERIKQLPQSSVDLEPVMSAIAEATAKAEAADAKAVQAEKTAQNSRQMVIVRDPRLETLEGVAAVVQERTNAADIEHLSLHTTDADIYSRLDNLQALKATQDELDDTQQDEIDALEAQFAQQLAQLQALLAMPPSATAQDVTELKLRVKALEDARIEWDRQQKTIPNLTILASSTDIAFTWKKPFTDTNYDWRHLVLENGLKLASVTVTEKAGTKTKTGITLTVTRAGVNVSSGILDVIAFREVMV